MSKKKQKVKDIKSTITYRDNIKCINNFQTAKKEDKLKKHHKYSKEVYQGLLLDAILTNKTDIITNLIESAKENPDYLKAILDYRLPKYLDRDNVNTPTNTDINKNSTYLVIASRINNSIAVEGILNLIDGTKTPKEKEKYINARDDDGTTALMMASFWGETEMVKLLLDKGADVNTKNNNDFTAFIGASREGHTETVKLLLEAGANPFSIEKESLSKINNGSLKRLILRYQSLWDKKKLNKIFEMNNGKIPFELKTNFLGFFTNETKQNIKKFNNLVESIENCQPQHTVALALTA